MLRPVQHKPLITAATEYASPADIEHARYLATTNLKPIEDERVQSGRVAFLKLFLPELAQYGTVCFSHTKNYWLVQLETIRVSKEEILPLPEHIGGCPVYHMQPPVVMTDSFLPHTRPPYDNITCQFGSRSMTPAEFLAEPTDLCGLVQAVFRYAIGIRLHPWHYIDILYLSKRALKKEVNYMTRHFGLPSQVCYMEYDMKVWDEEVKLPGTTMVRFDPKTRIEFLEWVMNTRQYHRDMDNFVREMKAEIAKLNAEDFASPQGDTSDIW